jgi:hypothetical protein
VVASSSSPNSSPALGAAAGPGLVGVELDGRGRAQLGRQPPAVGHRRLGQALGRVLDLDLVVGAVLGAGQAKRHQVLGDRLGAEQGVVMCAHELDPGRGPVLVGIERQGALPGLDLVLGQAAGGGDRDGLLLAGLEVARVHADDAVGVDLEGDLDLHLARGRPAQPVSTNSPSSSFSSARSRLALQHQDLHRGLVVARRW